MERDFKIHLTSGEKTSHELRKEIQMSLCGHSGSLKKGSIFKFASAIGFLPVMDDFFSQYPVVKMAEIESPENYRSPYQVLLNGLRVNLSENGILDFIIPNEMYEHPNPKYTYCTENIFIRFQKFLKKIYPKLCVTAEYSAVCNSELVDDVLDCFYKDIDPNSSHITIESSISRLLTTEELDRVKRCLSEVVSFSIYISQEYCETCAGYDASRPYHIEVIYS